MDEEKLQVSMDCKTPANIAAALANSICVKKTDASWVKLLILGFFAGVYISFGAALATLVGHDAAKYVGVGISKFIIGGVFSVGLMLVVIAGAELFTGNNLMIMSALDKKVRFKKVLGKWVWVYGANFIGALFMAWLMFGTNLWKGNDGAIGLFALKIAVSKVDITFNEAFLRAICCNWLVCLAVWMAIAAREVAGKVLAIFFPIMAFVALGFEHCIANMYFIPMGILLKTTDLGILNGLNFVNLTWSGLIWNNLLPVTLGNIVGGAFFVATLYWYVYVRSIKA